MGNRILAGAREALAIGQAHAARITWFLELSPQQKAKIVITGDLDIEMIEAIEAYLARQRLRLARFAPPVRKE